MTTEDEVRDYYDGGLKITLLLQGVAAALALAAWMGWDSHYNTSRLCSAFAIGLAVISVGCELLTLGGPRNKEKV